MKALTGGAQAVVNKTQAKTRKVQSGTSLDPHAAPAGCLPPYIWALHWWPLPCLTLLKHTYFLKKLSHAPKNNSIKTIFELGREISQVFSNLVHAPGLSQLSE